MLPPHCFDLEKKKKNFYFNYIPAARRCENSYLHNKPHKENEIQRSRQDKMKKISLE